MVSTLWWITRQSLKFTAPTSVFANWSIAPQLLLERKANQKRVPSTPQDPSWVTECLSAPAKGQKLQHYLVPTKWHLCLNLSSCLLCSASRGPSCNCWLEKTSMFWVPTWIQGEQTSWKAGQCLALGQQICNDGINLQGSLLRNFSFFFTVWELFLILFITPHCLGCSTSFALLIKGCRGSYTISIQAWRSWPVNREDALC